MILYILKIFLVTRRKTWRGSGFWVGNIRPWLDELTDRERRGRTYGATTFALVTLIYLIMSESFIIQTTQRWSTPLNEYSRTLKQTWTCRKKRGSHVSEVVYKSMNQNPRISFYMVQPDRRVLRLEFLGFLHGRSGLSESFFWTEILDHNLVFISWVSQYIKTWKWAS